MSKRLLKEQDIRSRYPFLDPTKISLLLDQSDPRSYGNLANWYDISGNGRHIVQSTADNQPAIQGAAALAGAARYFAGVNDYMLAASTINYYGNSNKEFSVILWIKVEIGSANAHYVISQGGVSSAWYIRVGNQIRFFFPLTDGSGIGKQYSFLTDVRDGLWHQVGMTWKYVGGLDGDMNIYFDGINITSAQAPTTDLDVTTLYPPDNALDIGGVAIPYTGHIDNILLYSGTLTDAQVQQLYLSDKPRHGGM